MKVLIAVDGSAGSFEAVSQIAKLVSPGTHELALYCSPPEIRVSSKSAAPEVLARAREALAQAIFEEARKRLPAEFAAAVHTIVGKQDPRHGVVAAAEQWSAQLIVVGARGLGAFDRLLLGSVSRSVVHGSKIPVWVARASTAPAHAGMNVLLACESPELGRAGAELLGQLNWPDGTTCRALTVIPSMFAGHVPEWLEHQARSPDVEAMVAAWAREHDEEIRVNVARMQDFCRDLPPPCRGSQPLVVEGEPTAEILKAIGREHTDLVVVGVKRKHSIADAILGSTSEAVLNHASCSVLLVPHRESP